MAVSTGKTWKGKQTKKRQELELPSGNTAIIKRVPMENLLTDGHIPNSLVGIIMDQLGKNAGDRQMSDKEKEDLLKQELEKIRDDPARLADMAKMASNIAVAVMVEPRCYPLPEVDEDRDEDLLYVDDVTMEDKMFIFNVCVGGSEDLERFRDELAPSVAPGEDKPKPRKATKRTTKRQG